MKALRWVQRAERLLEDAVAAADAADADPVFLDGVTLARIRLKREEACRDAIFVHLADSLPAHVAAWFLPDDP